MDDMKEIMYFIKKGTYMSTTEKFYIYRESKKGNQLNGKNTVSYIKIFKEILNRDSRLPSHPVNTPLCNQYPPSQ
jgi:hypothetical protein